MLHRRVTQDSVEVKRYNIEIGLTFIRTSYLENTQISPLSRNLVRVIFIVLSLE